MAAFTMGGAGFLWGGVDAGGTTFKCGVSDGAGNLLRTRRVGVGSDPDATLSACVEFFTVAQGELGRALHALGVACFGPLDRDPQSPDYGTILDTPKAGWNHVNVRQAFARRLGVPVVVDTDVNAALAAEMRWGAARGARSAAYVTVGTGIGAGIYANGAFLGQPAHPEFGHIMLRRHPADEGFAGICPFHGDCLEGLASARAVAARFGAADALAADHPAWRIEAFYLAQAALNLFLMLRPQKIVLGGGVLLAPALIDGIRREFSALCNGYLSEGGVESGEMIVLPGLGDDAGLLGGVLLASQADGRN